MVIVRLEREVRARAEAARPAAEKVGAREVGVLGQDGPEGGPEDRHRGPLPALPRIDVSLNAERIARARVPVRPESALPRPPGVVLGAARIEAGVTVEPLAVAPIVEVLADAPPVADAAEGALLGAAASGREAALRLSRALRDDVDHAVDGVGAPERAARAADDLDAVDVLEERVLDLPVGAGEQRIVDAAPVDQHEHRPRQAAGEASHADRPLVGVDSCHLDAGGEPQRVGERPGPRAPDLVLGDDVDRIGGRGPDLRLARHGGDLRVHQLLEAELGEVAAAGGRGRPQRAGRHEQGEEAGGDRGSRSPCQPRWPARQPRFPADARRGQSPFPQPHLAR